MKIKYTFLLANWSRFRFTMHYKTLCKVLYVLLRTCEACARCSRSSSPRPLDANDEANTSSLRRFSGRNSSSLTKQNRYFNILANIHHTIYI